MMNKRPFRLLVPAVLLSVPAALGAGPTAADVSLTVTPDRVDVGTFYHGTSIGVTARSPRCDAAILTLESEGTELVLNRKGRFGPVWMNVAKVTVKGAPGVYILASSENLEAVCSTEQREELELGFEAFRDQVTFTSDKPLTGTEFDEFLNMKRHMGTYSESVSLEMTPIDETRQTIATSLSLPSVMPSGDYIVHLYCFEDGIPIADAVTTLTIGKIGLPRLEYDLAHQHAAAYGLLAILAAMAAGIATGVAFTSKGSH